MAKGANGNKVKCVFYFPTDPGYRDTARMLVESGIAERHIHSPGTVHSIPFLFLPLSLSCYLLKSISHSTFLFRLNYEPSLPPSRVHCRPAFSLTYLSLFCTFPGLVLALDGDKIKVGGGSWTPATCQVRKFCLILCFFMGLVSTPRMCDSYMIV